MILLYLWDVVNITCCDILLTTSIVVVLLSKWCKSCYSLLHCCSIGSVGSCQWESACRVPVRDKQGTLLVTK